MNVKKIILTVTCVFSITSACATEKDLYAIIVDAGSSGSRLHLFHNDLTQSLPAIQDVFSEKTSTPLASFASHPNDAGASLKPLLDDAIKYFAANNIPANEVSIRVYGTAGMRLLDNQEQYAIYANVNSYIATNYAPTLKVADTRTISGKEEGLFDWLDINYLSNTFANHSATFGSIDMGGASTQIAFEVPTITDPQDEKQLTVNNQHYNVFIKSFLGFGQDQSRYSMNNLAAAGTCYPSGYVLSNSVTGNFNFSTCTSNYSQLIDPLNISETVLPLDPKQQFIAFAGAYYTFNFFGVDKTPNQKVVEKQVNSVCTESWDQMKINYPTTTESYLSTYCANGVYIDDLFFNYYHLQDNQLQVLNTINSKGIDWTLGAMLYNVI